MELRQLPAELWELIVLHVAKPRDDSIVALPASHIVTKTLYSCLSVSKSTHAASLEQLYQRCLYVDSPWRLRALVRSYSSRNPVFGRSIDPSVLRCSRSTSLFLKPFSEYTIDERNVVVSIQQLFGRLSGAIRRLVIDMPLRSYYPDEQGAQSLRSILRRSFTSLTAVEEFVSVRDELYLSTIQPRDHTIEPPVWTNWTHLRRLALYNLDLHDDLASFLNAMPNLNTIVLTRPDMEEDVEDCSRTWPAGLHICVVNSWRDHITPYRPLPENGYAHVCGDATIHRVRSRPSQNSGPLPIIDIICVDGQNPVKEGRGSQRSQLRSEFERSSSRNWADYDLRYTFNDPRVCQDWVKQSALEGSLWPETI